MTLRIGIDLDNTLVCYDRVFEALARERGITLDGAVGKKSIRDAVRAAAGNDVWTEMQGLAYGPRMKDASAMPDAEKFLAWARGRGVALFIVSHKTRRSAIGDHDLHAPAAAWLRSRGFEPAKDAFLEETREAKFGRIAALGLTHFIDDLEEFLTDPLFPKGVERIHFVPNETDWKRILKNFEQAAR